MTVEEHELIKSEIKVAVMEGFTSYDATVSSKISASISSHQILCNAQRNQKPAETFCVPSGKRLFNRDSFIDAIKDWRTIAVSLVIMAWVISATVSAIKGTPQKFSIEQVKQIAQQVQEVTNPTPVTNSK